MNLPDSKSTVPASTASLAWAGAALLLVLATMSWASFDQSTGQSMAIALLFTLLIDGSMLVAWFAGAWGYGRLMQRALLGNAFESWSVAMAMGTSAQMILAWTLGWAGWLNAITSWALIAPGLTLAIAQARSKRLAPPVCSWAICLAAVPLGLLLTASTIAPGMLWRIPTPDGSTTRNILESYDALSYHLQLPRQWVADGAIRGLQHNVYSYLPGGLEAIFTQLLHMHGDTLAAATTCQLLHALLAILAATCIAQLTITLARRSTTAAPIARIAGSGAGALYLAAPWTIATGSMAFNDQATNALGLAALLIALHPHDAKPMRRGLAAGGLIGAACLAKLTAAGLWGLPVLVVLIVSVQSKRGRAIVGFILAAAVPLGLYMLRNGLWTGNPLFPMATDWLGLAHWTSDQANRWQQAHLPDLSLMQRIDRLRTLGLMHPYYAFIIWPAALAGAMLSIAARRHRREGLVLSIALMLQVFMWIGPTHLQSRFLLPALAIACVLTGLGAAQMRQAAMSGLVVLALVGVTSWQSIDAYRAQWLGRAATFIGQTREVSQWMVPWGPINQLPADAKIYAEGFAQPFYVGRPMTYHTVWDTSPLGALMHERGAAGAIQSLRDQGYTHLLIDYQMLRLWWGRGNYGYDPRFGPDEMRAIEQLRLSVAFTDPPPTCVLYELSPTVAR